MQKMTHDELNRRVAGLLEPMPTETALNKPGGVMPTAEWIPTSKGGWHWKPRHNYTADDAAMRLFDELAPAELSHVVGLRDTVTVGHIVRWGDTVTHSRVAKTRPVAICLAFLAFKGVTDVEVCDDN
jgi:hypothetical protein